MAWISSLFYLDNVYFHFIYLSSIHYRRGLLRFQENQEFEFEQWELVCFHFRNLKVLEMNYLKFQCQIWILFIQILKYFNHEY